LIRLSLFLLLVLVTQFCHASIVNIKVLSPNSSVVKSIVVYLTPNIPLKNKNILTKSLVITQKNKQFTPYIEVIQKGYKLNFHNNDDITHHIYSVSGKNRFSFKIKGNNAKKSPVLDHVGEIAMGCNIHDWMSGYVLVVDTPYFTKTNTLGVANFNNIPPGEYKLTIWHPQLDVIHNKIEKTIIISKQTKWTINLPKDLKPLPNQESQDEFDFLEGY